MPGVANVHPVPYRDSVGFERSLPDELWRPNLDGSMGLRFSRPGEIGMGASTWGDMKLIAGGRDVTGDHPRLSEGLDLSLAAIDFFYPWDCSGTKIAIPLMGRDRNGRFVHRLVIYDVDHRIFLCQIDDVWCSGIVWSPRDDQVLVVRHEEAEIIGTTGDRRLISAGSHIGDGVLGAWTPDGQHVVLSPSPEPGEPERLLFVSVDTLETVAVEDVDPAVLLPYDEPAFRTMADGYWIFDPDRSDGGIWDTVMLNPLTHGWLTALFEASSPTLLLGTYRPTFELAELPARFRLYVDRAGQRGPPKDHLMACTMRMQWVSVTLRN
jgi:hypothetical protein